MLEKRKEKEAISMYTSHSSAKLTRVITWVFAFLLLVLMIFSDMLLKWFFKAGYEATVKIILVTFYICCPAAWCALYCIERLLKNIIGEDVFIQKNVLYLRVLSWCCAFVALACLISGFLYVPFFIFSLGATFMMLILRVLKNVMAAATKLKDENELTI